MDYTPNQKKYIDSVVGAAHMSAVEIIGELDRAILELSGETVKSRWLKSQKTCRRCGRFMPKTGQCQCVA